LLLFTLTDGMPGYQPLGLRQKRSVRHGISSVLPVTILMDKGGLTREIIAAVAGLALY